MPPLFPKLAARLSRRMPERVNATSSAAKRNRVNEDITSDNLRLIDAEGNQVGIQTLEQALSAAEESGLDLVEIGPAEKPPVCRLMDYGKYLFHKNRKRQSARRKVKQIQVKELKFRPGTGDNDYDIKMRNMKRFLKQGNKVKVTLRFRGREMMHQNLGTAMLSRIRTDLGDSIQIEQMPRLEGRLMIMILAPAR